MYNYQPMTIAPDTISGAFNMQQKLYSVSKKGLLTLLATAEDCTYSGDQKIIKKVDKTIPRIAIKTIRSGNSGWENIHYFAL